METANQHVLILTSTQVDQKIRRIAHQILENYHNENEIILVGVANKGFQVAKRINEILSEIFDNTITLAELKIHKDKPLTEKVILSMEENELKDKVIILIDDVLNSGRTLIYACKYLLDFEPRKMNTAVLVDRRHRKYPIRADFVGLTLSTTLEEHISVDIENNQVVLT